jgi:hypothetical protein
MTAKEKLRVRVEELTEQEAEATLDFIASRGRDDFARWLDSRPEDDEPLTDEDMGDLSKDQYVIRRQALEQDVERIGPPVDPDIARAEALLDDFARIWEIEKPAERHKLLGRLFDRIWQDGGQIVAVTPREPFVRYFQAAAEAWCLKRERRGQARTLHTRRLWCEARKDERSVTAGAAWRANSTPAPRHADADFYRMVVRILR